VSDRLVIGCMTGTSLDALDIAAVRIVGHGLTMTPTFIAESATPLDSVAPRLRELCRNQAMTPRDTAQLAFDFGTLHANAISKLIDQVGRPDLISVHGQTVMHAPPLSWQLLNPWPIARAAECPVVYDLRGADLAHGGQGAPITPIADWILFRDHTRDRAIVNLGGFCNISFIPANAGPERVSGLDVCACNHILDAVARIALKAPYDHEGSAAASGAPNANATRELQDLLAAQRRSGRSLGSGDEITMWIDRWAQSLAPHDAAASASTAIAATIASAIPAGAEVLCAGGSVRHRHLMNTLAATLGRPIDTTARHGIPPTARESVEFAILGALCADGVPITLPNVTNTANPAPISGAWCNVRGVSRLQSMTTP